MDFLVPLLAENDEEIAIFDMILNTKNRTHHYLKKIPGVFRLDELDDNYCYTHFRFYKADIRRLRALFEIPHEIILESRVKVSGEEAMCILLLRLSYPNRYADLMKFFPRGRNALSSIFNAMVYHILQIKGDVLENASPSWLSREHVRDLCQSLNRNGCPYPRCFGFLDGTIRASCRPVRNQRQMGVVTKEQLEHGMDYEVFIQTFGNVIEHCQLCAAAVWAEQPFKSLMDLHAAICRFVDELPSKGREGILRLHPDLAGRLAEQGSLTSESSKEQVCAGLNELTQQERSTLQENNTRYKEKFGFPFVICARENKKQAIINGIQTRLDNDKDKELATGITEVKKIAFYRLLDIVQTD